MVEIADRPRMIESPRITAADVVWESYEEIVSFLASHGVSGDDTIFQNERGEWVRWWLTDDPDNKRFNPQTGIVEARQVYVQRRVALTQADAVKPGNDWDFLLPAEPGQTLYGQPYVWMHGGRKPEADPGFWYAREERQRKQRTSAIREAWKPLPATEAAGFIEQQKKIREQAEMTDLIQASIEVQQPDAPRASGGKGR